MSHDVRLIPAEGQPAFTADAVRAYFGKRTLYDVSETGAAYSHEETGVYFAFEFGEGAVTCSVNYNRPSFFGAEAAVEVRDFARVFGARVDDPQAQTVGPFSPHEFLASYNRGNRAAVRAMPATRATYPHRRLFAMWHWNYTRAHRQRATPATFIPKIALVEHAGRVVSLTTWTDGIPTLLPEVDFVMIVRGVARGLRKPDMRLAAWDELAAALTRFPRGEEPSGHLRLDYDETPDDVAAVVARKWPKAKDVTLLAADRVLDEEFFAD